MADLGEVLLGLFTEIAILEHLARTRVERKFADSLGADHFGILNYFVRHHGPDSVGGLAWAFQEDEDYTLGKVRRLGELGYVSLTQGIAPRDTMVAITDAGRKAASDQLARMAPDFAQLVAEIPIEDLVHANHVLHEIRLVMDNLPDR